MSLTIPQAKADESNMASTNLAAMIQQQQQLLLSGAKMPRLDLPTVPVPSGLASSPTLPLMTQPSPSSPISSASRLNSLLTAPTTASKNFSLPTLPASSLMAGGGILSNGGAVPNVLQSLLSRPDASSASSVPTSASSNQPNLAAVGNIVSKFTRTHHGENGKESIQCLVCSKWFAVPPVKHLRGHMINFKDEKKRVVSLIGGSHVCIICYETFDSLQSANAHLYAKHDIFVDLTGAQQQAFPALPQHPLQQQQHFQALADQPGSHFLSTPHADDIPTVIDLNDSATKKKKNDGNVKKVELDNAGRSARHEMLKYFFNHSFNFL